jgi:hypothetical protein
MKGSLRGRAALVAALVGLAVAAAASASGPGRSLVWMREDNGQTWETVAVETNGASEVGVFIGETSGTHYVPFRLSPGRLAALRSRVSGTRGLQGDSYLGKPSSLPFVNDIQYLVETPSRSFTAARGHAPAKLNGLIADLGGLIERYSPAATTSPQTKPRFGEQ